MHFSSYIFPIIIPSAFSYVDQLYLLLYIESHSNFCHLKEASEKRSINSSRIVRTFRMG